MDIIGLAVIVAKAADQNWSILVGEDKGGKYRGQHVSGLCIIPHVHCSFFPLNTGYDLLNYSALREGAPRGHLCANVA